MANFDTVKAWISADSTQPRILEAVRTNPSLVRLDGDGYPSPVVFEIVLSGNVELLKQVSRLDRVYFRLGSLEGMTLLGYFRANRSASLDAVRAAEMEAHLTLWEDWDRHCELAKHYLDTTNERVWTWLRTHSPCCYVTLPCRRWSIAMQVVFNGHVDRLETLLRCCPQTRGGPNIWLLRNDGKTLLDVAESAMYESETDEVLKQAMLVFVQERTALALQFQPRAIVPVPPVVQHVVLPAPPVVQPVLPPVPPAVSVAAPTPGTLEFIQSVWNDITPTNVKRQAGVCPISLGEEVVELVSASMDCTHAIGKKGLRRFLVQALRVGPFPVHCPVCMLDRDTDRGIITRGSLKGLCLAGVLDQSQAQRLLLQQTLHIADEASMNRLFASSKPCPFCQTPISHFKGHGSHHIRPGGGCPSCGQNFCYSCLGSPGVGTVWLRCPNDCKMNCDKSCDCPDCPDCALGIPCLHCDGPGKGCIACS